MPSRTQRLAHFLGLTVPGRLSRAERTTLIVLVCVGTTIALGSLFQPPLEDMPVRLYHVAICLLALGYLGPSWLATLMMLVAMVVSFPLGVSSQALLALSLATFLVFRTGTATVVWVFISTYLLAVAAEVTTIGPNQQAIALTIAVAMGVAGSALRLAANKEQTLRIRISEAEQEKERAANIERQRIADDLHDVIAHDLTIVVLHADAVRLADSEEDRAESNRAMASAARRALTDLRRVVDASTTTEQPTHVTDLPVAFADAQRELSAARFDVRCVGTPDDDRIPRLVQRTLARALRESVTNVVKHGVLGIVTIHLDVSDDQVSLEVRNPRRIAPHRHRGRGTTTIGNRVRHLNGTYVSRADGTQWVTRASFLLQ